MARAKRHYIPGYVWHTPVKQNKKRFNGVNNPPMSIPHNGSFVDIMKSRVPKKGKALLILTD
jgi:hypothetical protein